MCDANGYALGAVFGRRREKIFRTIYYSSRTLDDVINNYSTTEKEMLAMVHVFEKFWPYLVGRKIIVYTDHAMIKYLCLSRMMPNRDSLDGFASPRI